MVVLLAWAPKADRGSHSQLWIRTLVNQHHCMPDKHSHEANRSVSRSIRSPRQIFIVNETVGRTCQADIWTFPFQVRVRSLLSCHWRSMQQKGSTACISKQQTHMQRMQRMQYCRLCRPKQTTSVLQPYTTVRSPSIICQKHLLPWSHGPPRRRLLKGLVTAKGCAGIFFVSKSQQSVTSIC